VCSRYRNFFQMVDTGGKLGPSLIEWLTPDQGAPPPVHDADWNEYFTRIGMKMPTNNTKEALFDIVYNHCQNVPFENISRNVGTGVKLTLDALWDKIVRRNRGGNCFELNCLLAEALRGLKYRVKLLPAYKLVNGKFTEFVSHCVLVVGHISDIDRDDRYFVDVGIGEPPLEPLPMRDATTAFVDAECHTRDGMESRIRKNHTGNVQFEWKVNGEWQVRCKFAPPDMQHLHIGHLSTDFQQVQWVLEKGKSFQKKLLACIVNDKEKVTLSGTHLKITSPRFGEDSKQTVTILKTTDEVREVLLERFGIPKSETEQIDISHKDATWPVW